MERRKRGDRTAGRWGQEKRCLRADGVRGALICAVYAARERYTVVHLPLPSPSSAWQGAGTACAGTWNVQNSSFVWLMNISDTMKKVGCRKSLMTCTYNCSLGACKCFLHPWKGREEICMQTEDLSSNLKEERDAAFTEMNSADTKINKKIINYTRIQKAGIVMALQWMSKPQEY